MFYIFMLNLPVTMRKDIKPIVFLLLLFFAPLVAGAQIKDAPRIDNPKPGDAIQGVITIMGSSAVERFQHYEVSYTQDQGENPTWFLIQQSDEPVSAGVLAIWDTSTITDGIYILRLMNYFKDGGEEEVVVANLRVRNYTSIETNTPEPVDLFITPIPLAEPTLVRPAAPTPTKLPANPAQVTPEQLSGSFLIGAAFALE
jgi:hypothetical protein